VITIWQFLSFILVATADAENPAKNNRMDGSILAQAKVIASSESQEINKRDLLFLFPAQQYTSVFILQTRYNSV
jgi:hypothetical protein